MTLDEQRWTRKELGEVSVKRIWIHQNRPETTSKEWWVFISASTNFHRVLESECHLLGAKWGQHNGHLSLQNRWISLCFLLALCCQQTWRFWRNFLTNKQGILINKLLVFPSYFSSKLRVSIGFRKHFPTSIMGGFRGLNFWIFHRFRKRKHFWPAKRRE